MATKAKTAGKKTAKKKPAKKKTARKVPKKPSPVKGPYRLTGKQPKFVEEYLKDPTNATQAAIRAGYSQKWADRQAHQLLENPRVQKAIAVAMQQRSKRTQIDADTVLTDLSDLFNADPSDILNDDWSLKPITDWPPVWRRALSGFDIQETFATQGNKRVQDGWIKKIKWPDKLRVLELMGKHVNVGAFSDKHEHTGKGGGPIQHQDMTEDAARAAIRALKGKTSQHGDDGSI